MRDDARLIPLLRIARIANALHIGFDGMLYPTEDQSPAANRRRWSSLLYLGALLHEGLQVAQGLGKPFKHLSAYRSGFAKLQGDQTVQWLRRVFLDRVRDQIAFHDDEQVYREALAHLDKRDEVIFLSGTTYRAGDIYFDLADDLAMEYLVDIALSEPAPAAEPSTDLAQLDAAYPGSRTAMLLRLMLETSQLSKRFIAATHTIIPVALREMGWRRRDASAT